jgi:hypothetical protein
MCLFPIRAHPTTLGKDAALHPITSTAPNDLEVQKNSITADCIIVGSKHTIRLDPKIVDLE